MAGRKTWSQEETDELIKLYMDGMKLEDLAEAIGKSYCSTKARLTYLRSKGVDLPLRDQRVCQSRRRAEEGRDGDSGYEKRMSDFDKAWYGRVPFGHWMITKPWKKHSNPMQE